MRASKTKKTKGRGRLVPTRPTGIAYHVRYEIPVAGDPFQHGKPARAMKWTNCSVRLSPAGRVPDGVYFLYADEGKVHQLRSIDGKWHCLAAAA
jgi:hypothetical protein